MDSNMVKYVKALKTLSNDLTELHVDSYFSSFSLQKKVF